MHRWYWIVGLALSAFAAPVWADPLSTKISLPKGPGSVEGLASADFSPSLSSGAASYSVPIAVPPGAAGFGPALSLAYDSSGGVTEIGIGWRLGGVAKIRRRVEDGLPRFDDTDTFELVGLGIPCELLEVSEGLFRPRYEDGSFVRVSRSVDGQTWEARTKSGVTFRFGGSGATESEGANTSAYLLTEELDRHGHRVRYEWDTTEGHALLTRAVWNDFDVASENAVVFGYEARPDHHRRFSSGIRETITRRLTAVEVRHGGALVRRYDLGYADGAHPTLAAITLVGSDGVTSMPAARFGYTEVTLSAAATQVVTMTAPPGRSLSSPDTALADMNGDGLPDVLVATAGQYRTYVNHDGVRWQPAQDWATADSPSVSLGTTGVQLADLDADGAPDLVVKSGTADFRYFPRASTARFDAPVGIATNPTFTFEDPDVRLADLDGDRRTDVIVTTPAGVAIGYNRAGTDFTEPALVGPVDAAQTLSFADGHTELCDVNGDRVEDFCYLRSGALTYWLGRGRGAFERAEQAENVPTFDVSAPYRLEDLNGDGWVDLVRVDVTAVSYALATAEGVFGAMQTIDGTPTKNPSTVVQLADMNGSGTTDILWVDTTSASGTSWKYLELFPDGRAGLLRTIDNGLGKVQTIEYEPAAVAAARARDAGTPWSSRMNVAMPVARRLTIDASLGDPKLVHEYDYRDGAYDPAERTFAGFGGSVERDVGDVYTPTLVTDTTFDTGLVQRVLRGAPLVREVRDDTGAVFTRTTTSYTPRTLATALDGRSVEDAFKASEFVDHVEQRAADSTRHTLTEYVEDDFGNVTEERRWGEVSGTDFLVGHDESLVTRTFANDADEWLLGYLATEETADASGARVAFSRKYYDGPAFAGLPLGQVTRGDLSREEAWVGAAEDAFELVLGTQYDADGNPTETKDARGGGHLFEWASDHTALLRERVKLDDRRSLVETAQTDGAFGNLLAVTEYNGQTTHYAYDVFGRLTAVVRPGDTSEQPTLSYSYEVSAPLSRVITEARVTAGTGDVEHNETLQDALGRTRGTLVRDGAQWVLAGAALLDARGNSRRSLLPRWVDAAAHDSPPLFDASVPGTDSWRDATARETRSRSPSGIETRTEHWPLETRHWDGGQNDAKSGYEHTPTVTRVDGLGRTVTHSKTLAGATLSANYEYDAAGALITRQDPEGATARYQYDGRGRRTQVVDPDQGRHDFAYDATGNLIGHKYPDGVVAAFTFDLAARSLTEDRDGDGNPDVTRTWDVDAARPGDATALGKLIRITDASGETEHTYDARGRITETRLTVDGASYSVQSEFDDRDREVLHVYPDGSSIAIGRNARGQINQYGSAVQLDYGGDGLETFRRFNTGVVAASDYDADRRRSDLTFKDAEGNVAERLRWTYDGAGNLTKLADQREGVPSAQSRTETYAYDNLYRLAAVTGTWGTTTWEYSPSGSLLARRSDVAARNAGAVAYGTRPHAPASFDGRAIAYDDRGRMTSDGVRAFTWDDVDELVAASTPNGTERNTYDGEGTRRLRVETDAHGSETRTVFIDPWSEIRDGKLVRYIVHAGQRIVRLSPDNGAGAALPPLHTERESAPDAIEFSVAAWWLVPLFGAAVVSRAWQRRRRVAESGGSKRDDSRSATQRDGAFAGFSAFLVGATIALVVALALASRDPTGTLFTVALLAALGSGCTARFTARFGHRARRSLALAGIATTLAIGVAACNGAKPPRAAPTAAHGSVETLTDADTLLATDLLGSLLDETTGNGKVIGRFSAYPYGATRFDTATETQKYAGTPRDGAVGLDVMGARFYAADLGVWTSADPLAVTAPERLVTADFAAANPYAYAKDSPVIAADRDGHFWHIAIGAAVGALIGGAVEAGSQYLSTGHIESWGRVAASAAGGAVSGAILAANPLVGIGAALGINAASGAAAGVAERLVASGGRSAGTVKDAVIDGAMSAATEGVLKGGAKLVNAAVHHAPEVARAVGSVVARGAPVLNEEGRVASDAIKGSLLRQQLAAEEMAGGSLPSEISGYTRHGLNQAIERDGVGVSVRAIGDAVRSPLSLFGKANGTFGFVGRDATVILNPAGEVVSTWANGATGFRLGH